MTYSLLDAVQSADLVAHRPSITRSFAISETACLAWDALGQLRLLAKFVITALYFPRNGLVFLCPLVIVNYYTLAGNIR